jgi:hypothetical protein
VGGDWSGCGKQFGAGDSKEDEDCTEEGAAAKMLVQDEVGGQAGEHRFESEEDGGVGGWKVLLGPALDGESGGSGEETGDCESDDKARRDRQMRSSAQG